MAQRASYGLEESGRQTFTRFVANVHLDWPLLAGLLVLASMSLVIQYSASGADWGQVGKHLMMLSIGFGVMFLVAQVQPHHIEFWTPWIFTVGVMLLAAVLLVGDISKGAQRWLDFGVFRFQPSEIMKLAAPMMVAWYLSEKHLPPTTLRMLLTLTLIMIPVGLILKQPDLGTATLVLAAGVSALLLTGISWFLIGSFIVAVLAIAPIMWFYGMHDYQRQRILTFLNPENDPLGTGYHIIQSKIAIGSGGVYGKGLMNGTQSQLDFLPERTTDFIFAVFGEEFGLIGIILLLAVYGYILFRGVTIAYQSQTTFNRLLAGSIILTFFIYVFVNMGMVSGILPVVGVPLPLISYGGTAMVTLMTGFGILMSIQTHRKLLTPT